MNPINPDYRLIDLESKFRERMDRKKANPKPEVRQLPPNIEIPETDDLKIGYRVGICLTYGKGLAIYHKVFKVQNITPAGNVILVPDK